MFVRTTNRIGKIALADSKDNRITWSALEPIDLPNPNSGNDAVALTDGAHRAYLQSHRKGKDSPKARREPRCDRGNMLQTMESESGEYSYSAIIQAGSERSRHVTPGTETNQALEIR